MTANINNLISLQGTEQIVVDPFDPKKHTTLSSVNFCNGNHNGSSGSELASLLTSPGKARVSIPDLCCVEGNCKENFCSSDYFIK